MAWGGVGSERVRVPVQYSTVRVPGTVQKSPPTKDLVLHFLFMAFATALRTLFLPAGYPSSVRKGYLEYQIWDVVQGMCSYLRGNLATRSTLIALGVGDVEASATSGALTRVWRDAASMIGSLLFTYLFANAFGRNIRQWRLFADVINDIGLTLAFVAPMFGKDFFLPVTIVAGLCTSACGISAGATKAAISQWFALDNNLTDLVAKEGSQETAVNVLGLIGGWAMLTSLNSSGNAVAWSFAFLTVLHVVANICAIQHLQFETLNGIRFGIIFEQFKIQYLGSPSTSLSPTVDLSPAGIASAEPLLPWFNTIQLRGDGAPRERLKAHFLRSWRGSGVKKPRGDTSVSQQKATAAHDAVSAWLAFEQILTREGWPLDG